MRFGIRVKLLIFAALVWAVIFGVYSVYIYKERIAQTRRMAITTADFLSRKIAADRQFYSSTIVKRALDAGFEVSSNYHDSDRAIPLPSTFTKEVSGLLGSESGLRIEILSLNPINPASGPRDAFQREALELFAKGSEASHYSFGSYGGRESVRYMIPDVATSSCVDCHNKNPLSPRRDYKIGDVIGGLEIVVPIESEMTAAMKDIWRSIIYGFAVIVSMGLVGLVFIRRVVTSPIISLAETAEGLASGDLTGSVAVRSDDEIGDLGNQINAVIINLHRMIEDIRCTSGEAVDISRHVSGMSRHVLEGSNRQGASLDHIGHNMEGINASIAEIARYTDVLADSVEKGSSSVLELGASINEVVDNMESLFSSVDETALSTKDMSFSIKEISENIENLSSAVTQVSSSMMQINLRIKEVETNAAEASRFAEDVIKDAREGMRTVESTIEGIVRTKEITRESTEVIHSLSEKIKEIGKILDVIREVAEETNLLALNAAIIAAQSGEHGKSFAVVSNEIKDLAERTSTSAKEVSEIIDAVEAESNRAVRSMERGYLSVEEGVKLSKEAGTGLRKIVESAQRSTTSVHEIARAAVEQAQESRMVAETTEKVAEMTRRIVNATQEQARGSELINKASERMSEIAYKVKGSTKAQVLANEQITSTIEDVNKMVMYINNVVREQSRNTVKVLEAIDAVRKVSLVNTEKAMETDSAVEKLAELNRAMMESVNRFKLKK
ncbi:MAG: methyl-accepting chemotaxis protein [Thermodesulfobacteriota bacterium]